MICTVQRYTVQSFRGPALNSVGGGGGIQNLGPILNSVGAPPKLYSTVQYVLYSTVLSGFRPEFSGHPLPPPPRNCTVRHSTVR